MVKLLTFILLGLGFLFTSQVNATKLDDELKDFCDVVPYDQLKQIAEAHIKVDKEFNEAITFLQSSDWANMLMEVQQNPEWRKLKKHLHVIGFKFDKILKALFNFIKSLKPIPNEKKTTRSLRSFFDDIELVLPIGKILAMLHEKKQNSTVFQEFYRKLSSEEVYKMFEDSRKQPEMKRILIELKSMGARVDDIMELFYGFMNWDSPLPITKRELSPEDSKGLKRDFEDFKKLIPWEKLKNITDRYQAEDEEFGEVVTYLQGPEFSSIITAIQIRPEYIELKNYLEDAGVDIEEFIKTITDIIFASKLKGEEKNRSRSIRSFRKYLDEVEGVIPIGKLLALFNEKMAHSEHFRRFFKKISEPKVKRMVEEIRALPESQELFEKLQHLGVRIREALIIFYAFLGWGSPFRRS